MLIDSFIQIIGYYLLFVAALIIYYLFFVFIILNYNAKKIDKKWTIFWDLLAFPKLENLKKFKTPKIKKLLQHFYFIRKIIVYNFIALIILTLILIVSV
tara:strand:- start:4009 stop:4305 length:297 start_codon:yes stop_codon:yes gene_type:complete